MNNVGKEYATALFTLACEEDSKKEYSDALKKIKAVFDEAPEYMRFLTSPSIPLGERLSAIRTAFTEQLPENVLSYLLLLCEKGRISCFYESVKEFEALFEASEHISTAVITSALELTDEEKQRLVQRLEALYKAKINAEYRIDKGLLGGIIVEVDGNVMDGSLRHRLREVKEVMNT